jgi:hypothetical protein
VIIWATESYSFIDSSKRFGATSCFYLPDVTEDVRTQKSALLLITDIFLASIRTYKMQTNRMKNRGRDRQTYEEIGKRINRNGMMGRIGTELKKCSPIAGISIGARPRFSGKKFKDISVTGRGGP